MQTVTPFRRAVDVLQPGATGTQTAALLDNRISRNVACNWLAGRRQAPRWAFLMLASKIRERALPALAIAAELEQTKERLGLGAGPLNLARWKARRS